MTFDSETASGGKSKFGDGRNDSFAPNLPVNQDVDISDLGLTKVKLRLNEGELIAVNSFRTFGVLLN